ncbi:MAG TPA: hypothetical protein DHV62_09555 [Elusimicrobia bacterium]|jgi:predicted nucleotidyltransferase|nr:hypothetical protein [Elusimicrobiota bacterium]
MEKYLNEFSQALSSSLGENLIALILYGSAVKGENVPKQSDVNVMVVLSELTLEKLSSLETIIHNGQRKAKINPVFWTEEELKNSADVFPVEFLDIKEKYRILYGKDIFSEITVNTKNLRHQLEFELRSKLLRMRNEWLNLRGRKTPLYDFLTRAGTSFLHLFNYAKKLSTNKFDNSLAEPFGKCIALKRKEIKLGRAELETLYSEVHNSVAKIIAIINEI